MPAAAGSRLQGLPRIEVVIIVDAASVVRTISSQARPDPGKTPVLPPGQDAALSGHRTTRTTSREGPGKAADHGPEPRQTRSRRPTIQTFIITAAALTLSLLAATSFGGHALAQAGGVEVGGNANNLTLVNRNTNAAIGVNSKAGTAIGTVNDAKVGSNLNNLTLVNRNTNAAIGVNTEACSEIGNIGKSDVCG